MLGTPKLQFQTKQEWLYRTLRDAIRNCELAPGERLLMDDLAAKFGVSRVPVREALLQLQAEGLVQMTPHAGAQVAEITFGSANDYFAISRELQVLACRAAAERITSEEKEELKELLNRMEAAAKLGDLETYTKINHEFHDFIALVSKMPLLPHFMDQFQQHWQRIERFYQLYPMCSERMCQTIDEHRHIVAALLVNDADEVEKASRVHNITGLEDHLKRIAQKEKSLKQSS
jgi:DNA-binding GntR family transcriptional regulator